MYKEQSAINKAPAPAPAKSNTIPSRNSKIIDKFYEDFNFKRTPKVWCKMRKRAKSVVHLLYKNGGKKCGVGEIT